jgi:hypothetical protein
MQHPSAASVEPSGNFLGFLPLRDFFSLDLRSLALLRVGIGIILICDWIDRLPELAIHYSDAGILPRNAITGLHPISLHMFSGEWWFQAVLAGIALVFSLLVLVGWRTPFVLLISWFLLISVHSRNPAVMQGGDQLLRAMMFWGMFLPLGARYSVDSSLSPSVPHPISQGGRGGDKRVLSPASVAYIVQLCLVYWFASTWKWTPEWRTEGTAVYLALKADYFATRFAHFLLGYPEFLRYLTFGTLWLEALGPAVLFFPFAPALQRLLVIFAFILFHVGLALSLELSNFPWVCCVAWLALLPTSFWDRIESQLRQAAVAGLTIYHDANRGRTALACLRTFLMLGEAKLAPAQDAPDLLPRIRREGGWGVVDSEGKLHTGVDALILLVSLSPLFSPLARLFGLRPVRWLGERFARLFAGGVYQQRPRVETAPAWTPPGGIMANTIVLFCLIYLILFNVRSFGRGQAQWASTPRERAPEKLAWLFPEQASHFAMVMGLEQGWGMFAPRPGTEIAWHLVIGTQKDGTQIDVLTGGPVNREKPEMLATTYRNGRWRKMIMNLPNRRLHPNLPRAMAMYYYRQWNATHEGSRQLRYVEIVMMRLETLPPDQTPPPPNPIMLEHYEPGPEEQ